MKYKIEYLTINGLKEVFWFSTKLAAIKKQKELYKRVSMSEVNLSIIKNLVPKNKE